MHKIIDNYQEPLSMITLVHNRGTKKYEAYSWLNDPAASNSTVMENIDALVRHMSAHIMGKWLDTEGLPHIYHMCCRAGMLVTTYYRTANTQKIKQESIQDLVHLDSDFGHHITPEELLALSKEKQYKHRIPTTRKKLIPFIFNHLIMAALHPNSHAPKADIFTENNWADEVFIGICNLAKMEHLDGISTLVDPNIFTYEEIQYFRNRLGVDLSK